MNTSSLHFWDSRFGLVVPKVKMECCLLAFYQPSAMKQVCSRIRLWKLHRWTSRSLSDIAKVTNAVMQGWWYYYGSFYPSAMRDVCNYIDRKLMQWARRKYRKLKGGFVGSYRWLKRAFEATPNLFVSWRLFDIPAAR